MKKIALLFYFLLVGSLLASCSLSQSQPSEDAMMLDGIAPKEDAQTLKVISAEAQAESL